MRADVRVCPECGQPVHAVVGVPGCYVCLRCARSIEADPDERERRDDTPLDDGLRLMHGDDVPDNWD